MNPADGYGMVEVETFGDGQVVLTASGMSLNGATATCAVSFTRWETVRLAADLIRAVLRR